MLEFGVATSHGNDAFTTSRQTSYVRHKCDANTHGEHILIIEHFDKYIIKIPKDQYRSSSDTLELLISDPSC